MDQATLRAPFTEEQVASLNDFQRAGVMHEFTCRRRDDHQGEGILRATVEGWVCDECDYTQSWAFSFMADRSWEALKWHA